MSQGKNMNIDEIKNILSSCLLGLSLNVIADRHRISRTTAQRYRKLLKHASLCSLDQLLSMSNEELIRLVYGDNAHIRQGALSGQAEIIIGRDRVAEAIPDLYEVDFKALALKYSENRNIKKVDLHIDYVNEAKAAGKNYLGITAFKSRLNKELIGLEGPDVYMHRVHKPGDELELDWCGDNYNGIDNTGKFCRYNIMVMVWAYSYYVFACLVPDLGSKSTIEGIKRGLEFFNCLPNQLLIDNPKSMVIRHRIGQEAILNESFFYFMNCCGIMVNANNPYSANEKSAAEHAVNMVQTRVLTRLESGLTYDKANLQILALVNKFINEAPFRKGGTPRKELFALDLDAAKPIVRALPNYREHFSSLPVLRDYHVKVKENFYSVNYMLAGALVDVDICGGMVVIYSNNKEIARHPELNDIGGYSTADIHMPKSHKAVREKELKYKNEEDIYNIAGSLSPELLSFCKCVLSRNNSFMENKKACIYLINLYKRRFLPQERFILNAAIDNVLHKLPIEKVNSYQVKDELKRLEQYADSHGGKIPVQTQLDFKEPVSNSGLASVSSFVRSNDDLVGQSFTEKDSEQLSTDKNDETDSLPF